jgi:RNA polymerase sigma-70 factor (ECF subfamily)
MDNSQRRENVTPSNMTDSEIITRILTGEKELYAIIVRRYNQRLYRVAMSIVDNDSEAEDIMQVAYIKAYENLCKFGFRSGFSTWLTRILINEALLRLKKRSRVSFQQTLNEEAAVHTKNYENQTPLSKSLNMELKQILEQSIRQLPEKYRTVFIMREIENLNISETGECLAISETNVKVRLNRAKAMLRDKLSNYYSKEDIYHFHLSRCDRVTNGVMQRIIG